MGKRPFTDATVIARIQARTGFRYQSAQLAAYFSVPTARMTEMLNRLTALKQVRRVRCAGNPTMYYVPSVAELQAEARLAAIRTAPVTIIRAESVNATMRRELGFDLMEKEKA